MIGIPNFDVTNQTGKQKFVDYIISLTRNEIISFTSSYNDNDNAASSGVLPSGLVPAGTIVMYGGAVLPDGYLWCDGTQQLIASYTSLFIALGVSRYGTDSATQFYLPNLTSRLPRGAATTGGAVTTNNNNAHGHNNNATTTTATTVGNPTVNVSTDANVNLMTHNHNNNTVSTNAVSTVNGGGAHGHSINTPTTDTPEDGGHSHTMTCGTPNNTNSRGATGTLVAVAASGHTHSIGNTSFGVHPHNLNTPTMVNTAGTHNHNVNAANADAGTTGNIVNPNTTMQHTHPNSVSAVQGTVTMGTITTGTVIDNTTYVPAFVEVNYIIKT